MTATDVNLAEQVQGLLAVANGGTGAGSLANLLLGDTFIGEVFDALKTQQNTVLSASNDFGCMDSLEIASTASLEIPATSTLEVLVYTLRRVFGHSIPGASVTINTDTYEQYLLSGLSAGVTVTLSGVGRKVLVGFQDNGTPRAITWANAKSSGVATLLSTTVANKTHWVGLAHDGTTFVCLAVDATGY